VAVVAGFKDPLAGLDADLESFEGLLLQCRHGGRLRIAAPAVREREGSHLQLDSAPVAGGELAGQVLLVRPQGHADDSRSLSDGGEDLAAGLRGPLLEGALDLLSYLPQIRKRVLPALHDEPVRVPEPGAQRGVVLAGISGERGNDTHGRLVIPPRSRPGLWVLLAITGDELEVTSQGRLDQLFVTQAIQVVHCAPPVSSRQWVSVQARGLPATKALSLSVTGMDVLR